MRISIFGLGYVGSVSTACLAEIGHDVVGVDVNPDKVAQIRAGEAPIVDQGLGAVIAKGVASGRVAATGNVQAAVDATDVSFLCVGTPNLANGDLDLGFLLRATEELGVALANTSKAHMVVVRSTVLPGTTETVIRPALDRATGGAVTNGRVQIAYNPEFLREGSAVADFFTPSRTVIGAASESAAGIVAEIYDAIDAPVVQTDIPTAEMVKFTDNSFHALKVAFTNEMAAVARRLGVDAHCLMDIVCLDTKLNLSPTYMRPGLPFGGSCLPKDLRALLYRARAVDVETPLLRGVLASNENQKRAMIDRVVQTGRRKVGVLGLSFKAGTDDLRESPTVELVEALIGKGYDVSIYDANVVPERLLGSNKAFAASAVPHLAKLMFATAEAVIARSDVILLINADSVTAAALRHATSDHIVVDFSGLRRSLLAQFPVGLGT